MIGRTLHSRSFLAIFKYVGRTGALCLGGNALGDTPAELAREFELYASLRPNLTKPVVHIIGAFAPSDQVTDEAMYQIACRHLEEQGYGNCLHSIWRHFDGTTAHYHLITCQVDSAGKSVSQSYERYRTKRTCRKLEIEFGLEIVSNFAKPKNEVPPPPEPTPEPDGLDVELPGVGTLVGEAIAREIQAVLPTCQTFGDLACALAPRGLVMVPQVHRETGQLYGLGYRMEQGPLAGSYIPGSRLPGNYSPAKLSRKHGLTFDATRDLPLLRNPVPPPAPTNIPAKPPVPKRPRKKKGERPNARAQRKPHQHGPASRGPCPWLPSASAFSNICPPRHEAEGTRLVRTFLGHPNSWAPGSPSTQQSLLPSPGTSPWRLARHH